MRVAVCAIVGVETPMIAAMIPQMRNLNSGRFIRQASILAFQTSDFFRTSFHREYLKGAARSRDGPGCVATIEQRARQRCVRAV